MIQERVITDRDNTIDLLVKVGNKNTGFETHDLSGVTRIILKDEDGLIDDIDSAENPSWFNWINDTPGKLILKLGFAGLEEGRYVFRVILFDAVNQNGLFWDRIMIKVI